MNSIGKCFGIVGLTLSMLSTPTQAEVEKVKYVSSEILFIPDNCHALLGVRTPNYDKAVDMFICDSSASFDIINKSFPNSKGLEDGEANIKNVSLWKITSSETKRESEAVQQIHGKYKLFPHSKYNCHYTIKADEKTNRQDHRVICNENVNIIKILKKYFSCNGTVDKQYIRLFPNKGRIGIGFPYRIPKKISVNHDCSKTTSMS